MIITAINPTTDDLEQTYLTNSYASGVTSVEVLNNQKIANNDRLLIGEQGLAQSEIITAGSPNANGTTQPIGATLFSHSANTPVFILQYDQVKFYRSTTGIDGTYSLLATVNLDVTNDKLQTTYDDTTAISGYYYKVSMFNSVSLVESAQSDPMPAITGWATDQVGYFIDTFLEEVGDKAEQIITRNELLGYCNEVNDDLQMQVSKPYRFLRTRVVKDRTANTNYLNFPTDSSGNQLMWKFDRLDYRFLDTTVNPNTDQTYTLEVLDQAYFRNRYTDNTIDYNTVSDEPRNMAVDDVVNKFVFFPPFQTTSTYGCFYLYYYSYFTRLTSEGNTFQTPTNRVYKLYALEKYYRKRSITEPSYLPIADRYSSDYNAEKARYKSQDRKDVGTPRRFRRSDWVDRNYRR